MRIGYYLDVSLILLLIFLCHLSTISTTTSSKTYQFFFPENTVSGHVIGVFDPCPNGTVIFSGGFDHIVDINIQSGSVSTLTSIDREKVERLEAVIVNNITNELLAHVFIVIEDENDNSPQFPSSTQHLVISESSNIGDKFRLAFPTDADTGNNGYVRRINFTEPDKVSNVFDLEFKSKEKLLYLVLKQQVERERTPFISFEIFAEDAGQPSRSSNCSVTITIADINDNPPVFANANIRSNILENTTVGAIILSLGVTDIDEGSNSEITYTLSGVNQDYFRVDASGMLCLTKQIHHEKTQQFSLAVKATDHGSKPKSSQGTIELAIIDTNNYPPTIQSKINHVLAITENNDKEKFLSVILIEDLDSDAVNGILSLTLLTYNSLFKIQSFTGYRERRFVKPVFTSLKSYMLSANFTFDYEKQHTYKLIFEATDNKFRTNCSIIINIEDANDNKPVFHAQNESKDLSVLSPVGSYLSTHTATDADSGENGHVTYRLVPTIHSKYFDIDSESGVITLKRSLQIENLFEQYLSLNVSATDSGMPPQQTFTTIKIFLQDKDKSCVPKIRNNPTHIQVDRKHKVQTPIAYYRVSCSNYSNISILSLQQNATAPVFRIDEKGYLFFDRLPGTGEPHAYQITIEASNVFNPTLRSNVSTFVTFIRKINPIPGFRKSFYLVSLPPNFKVPGLILSLILPIKSIVYSIINDSGGNKAMIYSTGELFLEREIPKDSCSKLTVKATNDQNFVTVTRVTILAEKSSSYIDSIGTIFERRAYSFEIIENSPTLSVVGKIALNYEIQQTQTEFHLDANDNLLPFTVDNEGFLRTNRMVDHEKKASYEFQVVAIVNCSLYNAHVKVRITDINENKPIFTSPTFMYVSPYPSVYPVYQVSAKDYDSGHNGVVSYRLLRNGNGYFCVNKKDGRIYLLQRINSNTKWLQVRVLAYDHGNPHRSSTMDLVVIVNKTTSADMSRFKTTLLEQGTSILVPFFKVLSDTDPSANYTLQTHSDIFGIYNNGWLFLRRKPKLFRHVYKLRITSVIHDYKQEQRNEVTFIHVIPQSTMPRKIFRNTTYVFTTDGPVSAGTLIGSISLYSLNNLIFINQPTKLIKLQGTVIQTLAYLDCESIISCQTNVSIEGVGNNTRESAIIIINVQINKDNTQPRFKSKMVTYDVTDTVRKLPKSLVQLADHFPNSNLKYEILTVHDNFIINADTGIISIVGTLLEDSYMLTLLVHRKNQKNSNDTMELTIYNRIQQQRKLPTNSTIHLTVKEDLLVGSTLYQSNISVTLFPQYTVSANNRFVVHPSDGTVQLIQPFDYEQQKQHRVKIYTTCQSTTIETRIFINVLNVNDNPPKLNQSTKTITIKDSASVGSILFTCNAIDLDQDVLAFSLYGENVSKPFFLLHQNNCSLMLVRDLRYFNHSKVIFKVQVSDGLHTATLDVTLIIERVTPPEVISPSAVVVSDYVKANKVAYTLMVRSVYVGARNIYSLNKSLYSSFFHLDQRSGELSIVKPLPSSRWYISIDFTVNSIYHSVLFNLLIFRIRKGKLDFAAHQYTRVITENNPLNHDLYRLNAAYPTTRQADINYYITAGNIDNSFQLDQKTGHLVIKESLDHERVGGKIKLVIHAVDLNPTSYSTATTEVVVFLRNLNDNPPLFEQHETNVWVEENVANRNIVNVAASDGDGDKIGYNIISGNDEKLFSIQQDGMVVLANTSLDYEKQRTFVLEIEVKDDGKPSLSSKINVSIHVIDVNDNQPMLTQQRYFINLDEQSLIGTEIFHVEATDGDYGKNGALHHQIISGDYGYFSIDVESGRIYLEKKLNCVLQCAFLLHIAVSDNGRLPRKSTSVLVVNIQPRHRTILKTKEYQAIIPENSSVGYRILQLEISPSWDIDKNATRKPKIIFSVFRNKYFDVAENGAIYTKSNLTGVERNITLTVMVSIGEIIVCTSTFEIATVHLVMNDTTNHSPRFPITPFLEIPESQAIGSTIGTLTAVDSDHGPNGLLAYTMINQSDTFQLKDGGQVNLLKELDFEETNQYFFQILVQDHGNPRMSVNQSVYVLVQDENDNSPIISANQISNISIPSNISMNQDFVQILATDADSGANGLLQYSLTTETPIFGINNNNGNIFIVNNTLLQHGEVYMLNVLIQDCGFPPLSAAFFLNVHVYEINTPPRFTIDPYILTVKENSGPLSNLYKFTVDDNDKELVNRIVKCQIINESVSGYFAIDSATGVLTLLRSVDYEEHKNLTLTIAAIDGDGQMAQTQIVVIVQDVNDSPPMISPNQIGRVSENAPSGTYILSVKAHDLDSGINGKLQYTLLNNKMNFKIDEENGGIKSRRSFDYELQKQFLVEVEVADSAYPYLKDTADIIIFIEDVNDSPPRIVAPTTLYLPLPTGAGRFLTQIKTTDADSKLHSHVFFAISSLNITINSKTGVVTSKSYLNQSFAFQVQVWDPTYPLFQDSASIRVKFEDPVKFPPIDQTDAFVYITENDATYQKDPIYTVQCKQCGPAVQYYKVSDDTTLFSMNSSSGELKLSAPLDYEAMRSHTVWIGAVEDSHQRLSSQVQLVIFVVNVNDNLPQFIRQFREVKIKENNPMNVTIFKVTAIDADEGDDIFFSFKDSQPPFEIDSGTGDIICKTSLGYEFQNVYNLTIIASNNATVDQTQPDTHSAMELSVTVQNINDNPPEFYKPPSTIELPEDYPVGKEIYRFQAKDIDNIGILNYELIADPSNSLVLNNKTGQLSLHSKLDRERIPKAIVNITVSDSSFVTCHSFILVITDVNDSPPRFNTSHFHLGFSENAKPSTCFYTFKPEDLDKGENKASIVEIASQDQNINRLFILHNNGTLCTRQPIQINGNPSVFQLLIKAKNIAFPYFETLANVTVTVSDINDHQPRFDMSSISNQKSVETSIAIDVIDMNDVRPMFSEKRYQATVPEDFNISIPILSVHAVDSDPFDNNHISYSLIPSNDSTNFTIDSKTGDIYAITFLDYETRSSYHITAQASDSGTPPLSNNVTAIINIAGINEYKPRFPSYHHFFNISRVTPIGSILWTFEAIDQDDGDDGFCVYKATLPSDIGFSIDIISGDLLVNRKLKAANYSFSVIAMNKYKPDFFDYAAVNLSVFDFIGPPVFERDVYKVNVMENITINSLLLEVSAKHHDGDKGLEYGLDENEQFKIEEITGEIRIASPLDYEIMKMYILTVYAVFKDSPKGFAKVSVQVLDINDNSPKLAYCTGNVTENLPKGTSIIQELQVTDKDDYPNAAPFHFNLMDYTDRFTINSSTGEIQTVIPLDREKKAFYNVTVRIADNGQPKLSSTVSCTIFVGDVNDNYGNSRDVKIYTSIKSLKVQGRLELGDVSPNDIDIKNEYNCSFVEHNREFYFDNFSCVLHASEVTIPDYLKLDYFGQHMNEKRVRSSAMIKIRHINSAWYEKPIAVFVRGISVRQFVDTYFFKFERMMNGRVAEKLFVPPRVFIVSVQSFQDGTVVVMVLSDSLNNVHDLFNYYLQESFTVLKKSTNLPQQPTMFDACALEPCLGWDMMKCKSRIRFMEYEILNSPPLIFHSRKFIIQKQCRCQPGHVGLNCSKVPTRCSDNPCYDNGICKHKNNEIFCSCSDSFNGKYCEFDTDECLTSPCQNGGKCVNKYGGFFCLCIGKYGGKLCENEISPCSSNPCINNGTCSLDPTSTMKFKCDCQFGDLGSRCETRSLNFDPSSYVETTGDFGTKNYTFSLEFATIEENALLHLVYTTDFTFIIEIQNGRVKVSIAMKNNKVFTKSEEMVSDGQFHLLEVELRGQEISITIDKRSRISKTHNLQRYQSSVKSMLIGGIKSVDDIINLSHQSPSSTEFIGCMRQIIINNKLLDITTGGRSSKGVSMGCKRKQNVCHRNLCGPGNECIDQWSHYECRCPGNVLSRNCLRGYQNVRLHSGDSTIQVSTSESERRRLLLLKNGIKKRLVNEKEEDKSSFSISFRTRNKQGIVFNSTQPHGKTILYLSDGKIEYYFENKKNTGRSLTEPSVNDGEWHQLKVWVRGKTASITLDSNLTTKHTFNTDVHQFVNSSIDYYSFGQKFKGCFGAVTLNGQSFVLSSSTRTLNVQSTSIEQGCIPTDVCANNPCQNNVLSYCFDTWESFKCIHQQACSQKNLCKNNGYCVPEDGQSFSCDCTRTPFGGKLCRVPLVCLQNPCQPNQKCEVDGRIYKCVIMESDSSADDDTISYVVAITLSVLFAIILFAVGTAFLSSKRRWKTKEKELKVEVFQSGFENEMAHRDEEYNRKTATRPYRAANSLPDLRERPFSILKTKYRSADNFLRSHSNTRKMSPDHQGWQHGSHVNHCFEEDNSPYPPLESGIESSYSDDYPEDEYDTSPEMYDMECASMQFSEMSFQQEQSGHRITETGEIEMTLQNQFTGYGTDSESSEAYFTCSESEFMTQPHQRRNPGFIMSEHQQSSRCHPKPTYDHDMSEISSVTWSNAESTLSKKVPKRSRRQKRHSRNLRQKVLASNKISSSVTTNPPNDSSRTQRRKLEQLSEAEEYV